ncbi:acetyl-coenzyme A carboxylase carboxyl transferase subunit alpha, chloroplastic isoform X1 [Elaeis guineensis]|uniref:acetyl-CoA carboxytransferase n=2 Tax=Elaeis guineensis var. tenera TaxID=51953 RepID=A0A6J0PSI0_ELAGV|nr:acetyl-coenzyme A carboxylase carboxyl transferase subunit alpha, chloroplastic [Elaeis guineensis]
MNSLPLSPAIIGGESCSFVSGSHINLRKTSLAADLQRGPFGGINGALLKHLGQFTTTSWCRFSVFARVRKGQKHEYPWPDDVDPNLKSGHLSYLSHFKPLTDKPKPVTLPFEKPLVDLEKKIIGVRKMAEQTGLDFSDQINLLESKYQQALKDLYTHLTPIQCLNIARHPNRPTFLDHVLNITDKWVELHGDRAGYDDPAIVTGIGSMDGKSYMFIGHQKGRNTKENIQRNFGMPTPHGYRKALRMMKYADHHGFPIITFIDTPGAYADLKSEELGQGEAIAYNLRTMFGLKVPIVTVVIGEGGSGGALAIGCANKIFMLQNSVFYVASPEACAAILWKSSSAAPLAAEQLRITATELCKLKIADGIILEPLGGAHTDPSWTSQQIKLTVTKAMEELGEMDIDGLLSQRHLKFRALGGFVEGEPVDPEKRCNMKKKEADLAQVTTDIEAGIDSLMKVAREAKGKSPAPVISDEVIENLMQEVDKEMTNAFISMGLQEKLEALKMELSESPGTADQTLSPILKERVDRLMQEFKHNLSQPGSYIGLKQKLEMLSEASRWKEKRMKGEKLKKDINEKLQDQVKGKMEILKKACGKVAKGEKLDANQIEEVEKAKEELKELLKSVNLEVVGLGKKIVRTAPPGIEEILIKADDVIKKEIEVLIDKAGLRGKIDELKAEIASGASKEKMEHLLKEIREGITAIMDATDLKKKVESTVGLPVQKTVGAGSSSG